MTREGIKITIKSRDIYPTVYHALTTIHHHHCTRKVSFVDDCLQVGTSAESVGCLRNCHQTSAIIKQLVQLLYHQATIILKRQHP